VSELINVEAIILWCKRLDLSSFWIYFHWYL